MNWAARRRFVILLIIGAVVVAFAATVLIATFSETPTCSDGVQNQDETGVDCGGSCAYLCVADTLPPTVLFTQAFANGVGGTDVVASVENKNAGAAAKDVPYRVTLYGVGQSLIQEVTGTLDLPPSTSVPVYVPGIASGKQTVTQAFLTIDPSSPKWYALTAAQRSVPGVSNITLGGTTAAPRVEAVLTNSTVNIFTNVRVIVLVHDAQKDVIAASQTIVSLIPAQGQAAATFTWSRAFSDTPTSIEVVPVIPLPSQ